MNIDFGDTRNTKTVDKATHNFREQKRIKDIKIKKSVAREENADIVRSKKEVSKQTVPQSPHFGLKNSRRVKNKLQVMRDRDNYRE